jgi:hypothetical protein
MTSPFLSRFAPCAGLVILRQTFVCRYQSMGNLLFWLGLGAAQKSAGPKEVKPSRHWVVSLVVGILLALLIGVGMFLLLVHQQ